MPDNPGANSGAAPLLGGIGHKEDKDQLVPEMDKSKTPETNLENA
jgi:hypothetical protein